MYAHAYTTASTHITKEQNYFSAVYIGMVGFSIPYESTANNPLYLS